jgi:hypothetical protein
MSFYETIPDKILNKLGFHYANNVPLYHLIWRRIRHGRVGPWQGIYAPEELG